MGSWHGTSYTACVRDVRRMQRTARVRLFWTLVRRFGHEATIQQQQRHLVIAGIVLVEDNVVAGHVESLGAEHSVEILLNRGALAEVLHHVYVPHSSSS